MLEIRLLGEFNLRRNGQTVGIPSRPAQSLLAFLILTAGTVHRRERLAGLLWPDISDADARRNLRRALWHIRKATDGQMQLQTDDINITFQPGAEVWADVLILTQPMGVEPATEDLAQAVSVYRGELLPGFYHEWTILERERLQVLFEQRIKLLLERLLAAQNWVEVLHWGERWINLGGPSEPAYQALMRAYAGQGDRSGVAKVFHRCQETLFRELGVEPSGETRQLFEELVRPESLRGKNGQHVQPPSRLPEPGISVIARTNGSAGDSTPSAGVIVTEPETSRVPPFKGLQFYNEEDAPLFFGREELVARLLDRLDLFGEKKNTEQNLLVIVGASGSGKSSLVRAGLVPAIRTKLDASAASGREPGQDFEIHIITPSSHPLEKLAASLTRKVESVSGAVTLMDDMLRDPRSLRLYAHRAAAPLVLVIDQFEELFTLCRIETERRAFVENIMAAVAGNRCKIILALRADFYAQCAQYDNLRVALATCQDYIGPMSVLEMRRAIEEPVKRAGMLYEPGLVDLILRDTGGEPGTLPLLSHALLETWKRCQGITLTLSGYAETGGVHGAIAHTAESVYNHLTPPQQHIARNIFLRLTELGEGGQGTRRCTSPEELFLRTEDRSNVEQVLNLLAEARLVTIDQVSVEIAHEALIREWPALRSWLAEDREGLRLHRRLTEAAQSWEELEHEPGELYRGARLTQAVEWVSVHPDELNSREKDFMTASLALAENEAAEKELAHQREMESVQRFAEAERRRAEEQTQTAQRIRWLAAGLAVLLLAAVVMTSYAVQQRNSVNAQARLATSRELAASSLTNLTIDPERSILLSVQALQTAYSQEAEDALHQAVQASHLVRVFHSANRLMGWVVASIVGKVAAWSVNPDGSYLTEVWNKDTGELLLKLPGFLAANTWPDASQLATIVSNENQQVRLIFWDAKTGQEISHVDLDYRLDESGSGNLSPDWTRLAVCMADGTTRVYDLKTGERLLTIGKPGSPPSRSVAFSPDGKSLVTTVDNATQIFDLASGQPLAPLPSIGYGTGEIEFSQDKTWVAVVVGTAIKVADVHSGMTLFTLSGRSGFNLVIDSDQEGVRIAAGGEDNKVYIWDSVTGQIITILAGHQAAVYGVAFVPWQDQLVSAADDGTVRLWDISDASNHEAAAFGITGKPYTSISFSPDGKRLAVSGGYQPGNIFDAASGKSLVTLHGTYSNWLGSIAFSPNGKTVASTGGEENAYLWDAATGEKVRTLAGHHNWIGDLAFSPDGSRLATIGYDGLMKIWDPVSGNELLSVTAFTESVQLIQLLGIDYSPDGTRIATAGSRQVKIWDPATGKELLALPPMDELAYSVAFSPDGSRLAVGLLGGNGTAVWDAVTGKKIADLTGHQGSVQGITFSRDGKRVFTGSVDGMVKIWDAASGKELLTLTRQSAQITGIALSPDGSTLAVSDDDGTARVFYLNIDDLIRTAKKKLTRSFTQAECQVYLHLIACPPG